MEDRPRLIEHAFPLEQASLDSVHEKNVRHGHISTLHIWPARRPLAACRAALIATLLPDPGTPEKRKELVEKIGGVVREKTEKKKMPNGKLVERVRRYTEGGILHWGLETENRTALEWFRKEIRRAHGGHAPKVLDPFAGGGAIPLEAMRLGCDATAIDINPVAWFILKCTLEYPQRLADQKKRLPAFVLKDREFMEAFLKAQGFKSATLKTQLKSLGLGEDTAPHFDVAGMGPAAPSLEADFAWHIRAWGKWVIDQARRDLAKHYPIYADFEPMKPGGKHFTPRGRALVPLKDDGTPDIDSLNAEFAKKRDYLDDPTNPRWILKPTVAYLWARTVTCKNCRATVPLLKTRWLCKKDRKRILLTMEPNVERSNVVFGIRLVEPLRGGNAAQRRENDKRAGAGTMSRSGAQCPCCNGIMTMEDIRVEGKAGRLGAVMTSVVTEGQQTKEYRRPEPPEVQMAAHAENEIQSFFARIPFGSPSESLPGKEALGFRVPLYGFDEWQKLFSPRQLLALGTVLMAGRCARQELKSANYPTNWIEAISAYLALILDKAADYNSMVCTWHNSGEKIGHTYARFALPITWDFAELALPNEVGGAYLAQLDWVARYVDHALTATAAGTPRIILQSATQRHSATADVVITDPPYYDAIPYSDAMDFFYVWLRRMLNGLSSEIDSAFNEPLGPKWDHQKMDGELIDDPSRFDGDQSKSKEVYEEGMFRAFQVCSDALKPEGRMVVVFANKQPAAWETLVSAIIRAGFLVDGSWPIQTEMTTRTRARSSAALSSSVWLVCRKRPITSRPGWDNRVLDEMRGNIATQLREFWDAGIRGPDFVWAATGPALESYSKYPAVKKARDPGKLMEVSEFLRQVRRIVVDFVVGQVLSPDKEGSEATGLDDATTYYLLHRHDFGMEDTPAGPCILYAVSCNLSDAALADQFDILARTGGTEAEEDDGAEESEEEEPDSEIEEGSGSRLRLKQWYQRTNPMMGYDPSVDSARARADAMQMKLLEEEKEPPRRRQIPLIDQVHRLMHLWKSGDRAKVDDYLEVRALVRHKTFLKLLQALIELSPQASDERSLLEKISNHIAARGGTDQMVFDTSTQEQAR